MVWFWKMCLISEIGYMIFQFIYCFFFLFLISTSFVIVFLVFLFIRFQDLSPLGPPIFSILHCIVHCFALGSRFIFGSLFFQDLGLVLLMSLIVGSPCLIVGSPWHICCSRDSCDYQVVQPYLLHERNQSSKIEIYNINFKNSHGLFLVSFFCVSFNLV